MKIVCFGDTWGVSVLLKHLPAGTCRAIVAAEIRPQYHSEMKAFSDSYSIPFVVQPKKTSDAYNSFVNLIKEIAPDLIFVNSYSMLLHEDILNIPTKGAFNIHGGLLPQYRGCNPIQWALLNNERETGITLHYMDAGFDTGDIVAQKKVPMFETDTWVDIQHRIAHETEEMLSEEILKILNGTNARIPQDNNLAKYWNRRKPEDGRIDWQRSSHDIYNLIRALVRPHPGAFYTSADGARVVIDCYMTYEQVRELQKSIVGCVVE